MMKMKKFLVNCYCTLVWNPEKRRAVRQVFFPVPPSPPLPPDPNEIFVPIEGLYDAGGICWGPYLLTHNMPEMVSALRSGLDEKSNQLLDLIFSRMIIFPKYWWSHFQIRETFLNTFPTPEELADAQQYSDEESQYFADYLMDEEVRNVDTFTYHSGLRNKSEKLKKYIAGKDFIDGGAYIGDTAMMYIKNYDLRCVYSFEISKKTCARYENIMRINNIPADKYKLCHIGLSDQKAEVMINDSGYQGTTILFNGDSKVQVTDLDSFALENNLQVGFIKADMEGVGLEATLGMTETIKRDRPVLCISIYHNPKEFFEIKPALDKITAGLDYKITIEKHFPLPSRTVEVVVFAYPKELDDE